MSTPRSSSKKRKARSATMENERDKSASIASGSTIAVALRIRPFLEEECISNILRLDKNQVAVVNGDGEIAFNFSYVFDMESTLDEVYEKTAASLVAQAIDGYNVCIMAYGQTGSGKTYCMSGGIGNSGIIPRFCTDLFELAAARKDSDQRFTVSFYEIYQEKAYDLLSDEHIPLRVRGGEDVYLQNLITCSVTSFDELEKLRRTAWTRRATESTAMNRRSSRSHAFMQLKYSHLESNLKELGDYVSRVTSNIYFVDLAGSERLSEVGYSYLDETVSINSSLSALHRVIFSAGSRLKPSYRDSLLTRLLKDCLGGNARTLLIANVTPSLSQRSETLSTLRFASQAATVRQCAIKNIDPVVTALLGLKQENEALKTKIEQLESSQKLVTFDLPVAPSIVEFQPDPALTTWEPLEKELSFSAFDAGGAVYSPRHTDVVQFKIDDGVITIVSREEGIFVNGEYLYPNIPSRAEHGDRVVLRGERFFFVYSDPNGMELFRKCSYHSIKAEYLERNMERFRAEVAEIERNRRRKESDAIVKALVEEIEGLKLALCEKENEQETTTVKERENLQLELENCIALKETFLELCKREISAFGVQFDSLAELFEAYIVKRDIEIANFILAHFGKDKIYWFEMVLGEREDGTAGVRLVDYKNKMFGDMEKSNFDHVLRQLKDYYRQFLVAEDGYETVGEFMFRLCRRKLQMARICGARMSNFAKTALYNSTVDAAKKRRTTIKEFRLSIGGNRRKSSFVSSFTAALGNLPEDNNSFKTQFVQRLIDICTFAGNKRAADFVELLCGDIVELKIHLMDIRAIQRGAITEGIGFFSVLCKFIALVQKIEGGVGAAMGFVHSLCIESCLKSVSSAWRTFTEFTTSWLAMVGNDDCEECFEEIGPLCLDGMFNALKAVVVALGKMTLFVGGRLPNVYKFDEIKEDFVDGSRQAVTDVGEEAEDFILRFQGRPNNSSEIALKAASALLEACKNFPSFGKDDDIYDVISPLFAVIQLTTSCVVDPIECLSAERDFARKSFFYLKHISELSDLPSSILTEVKDAVGICEKIIGKPKVDHFITRNSLCGNSISPERQGTF